MHTLDGIRTRIAQLGKPPVSIRDDLHNVRVVLHAGEEDTYDRLWGHVECKPGELTLSYRLEAAEHRWDHRVRFYLSSSRGVFLRLRQWWSASWSDLDTPLEPRSVVIRRDRRPRLSLTCGIRDLTWHLYQSGHFDVEAAAEMLLSKRSRTT